jgi:hypothetical protein
MAKKVIAKRVIFIVSIVFNALFLLLLLMGLGGSTYTFDFLSMDYKYGVNNLNSAFIVSASQDDSSINFGPVELTLKTGSTASLQFSVLNGGRQSNMLIEPLYDHNVVSVERSGMGITITGVSPGETVLQLFSSSGFKDIAHVEVY